jgi:hypothetical protein
MNPEGFKGKGGLPGLGFGVGLGLGTINTCKSEDQDFFCQASRYFQIFTWILTIVTFLSIAYIFLKPLIFRKGGVFSSK